jgi:hypothetical protein
MELITSDNVCERNRRFLHMVRQRAKAHEDGYKEALKWMREPENIDDHENDLAVSVPPFDAERAAELELVDKVLDLVRAVVVEAKG